MQNGSSDLDRLGDEIAELSAHLDASTACLLDLIREFDARGGWSNGFSSRLAQALARGQLSYAKVRALTRVATPETEERLLAVGHAGTADHVERIVRGWRRMDSKAEAAEATHRHTSRALHVYQDEDGMVMVRGRLAPEVGALLVQALAAAREALYQRTRSQAPIADAGDVSAETPTMAQQQADALALVTETALHHGIDPGAPAERYQVVVHIDAPVLADPDVAGQSVLEDGTHVSAETSRRLACDASRVVMQHGRDGRVVEVAARTRTIPSAIRRAMLHRDQGCRFPGCGVRVGQAHHIRHWAQGGPTTLSNLTLLCRRHHRAVHEEGYQVERLPKGELLFRRPDGRMLPEVPCSPRLPDDPVEILRARHAAGGLALHARTAMPGWFGEPLDVGYAIDVLHPRAQ
jgi:hypothetical protein